MKMEQFMEVLRIIAIFDALAQKRGEYRLGQITNWSSMSRPTVDRVLRKMVSFKLLEITESEYAGKYCRMFSVTEDGLKFMQVLGV